ncbi:MAG: glycoside hydrolase family 9 protein [Acidobacteriaceae bacterium]|nr:glycoside hydrolase family 9 protein [Acidobacteriaceae bacterium]
MARLGILCFCFVLRGADRTAAIKVDQAGYLPHSPKLALVSIEKGTAAASTTFALRSASTNGVVFQGKLSAASSDADSGDQLQTADFTQFNENGSFYIEVPGLGRSWEFTIGPDVFSRVYFLTMRGFYGQRCGTAVNLSPDFPQYRHAPCHLAGAYDASSGKTGERESARGWHDAGDYGRYVVNSGISTGTLLWTWELFGDRIKDISLHIPESGNGTPDILNEIRWNLDWMLSMQDSDGGVFHKQTSSRFCQFIMPEADQSTSLVIGTGQDPYKSSCATADLAAVAGIAARTFKPYDAPYADKCLRAAESAWRWLERYPNVTFRNPHGISTGAYGDAHCQDEILWAAAELWRTTNQPIYAKYFVENYAAYLDNIRADNPPSWSMLADFGLWSYVLGNGPDGKAVDAIKQRSIAAADAITQRTAANPYHVSLTSRDYIWGSNGVAANYSLQLLIANRIQPNPRYVETALDNIHYILGRNTFSLSWVTQVGEHSFQHPHHRPSAADGIAAPWPGLMSGGPNAGRQDQVMRRLVAAGTPPARSYVDETGAYSCNEIAINWNAPLVFTLAALVPK